MSEYDAYFDTILCRRPLMKGFLRGSEQQRIRDRSTDAYPGGRKELR